MPGRPRGHDKASRTPHSAPRPGPAPTGHFAQHRLEGALPAPPAGPQPRAYPVPRCQGQQGAGPKRGEGSCHPIPCEGARWPTRGPRSPRSAGPGFLRAGLPLWQTDVSLHPTKFPDVSIRRFGQKHPGTLPLFSAALGVTGVPVGSWSLGCRSGASSHPSGAPSPSLCWVEGTGPTPRPCGHPGALQRGLASLGSCCLGGHSGHADNARSSRVSPPECWWDSVTDWLMTPSNCCAEGQWLSAELALGPGLSVRVTPHSVASNVRAGPVVLGAQSPPSGPQACCGDHACF